MWTAVSKESQKDCRLIWSLENLGMLSFGSRLAELGVEILLATALVSLLAFQTCSFLNDGVFNFLSFENISFQVVSVLNFSHDLRVLTSKYVLNGYEMLSSML